MEIKKTLETDNSNNNSSDDKTEETTVKEDKKTEIEAEVNKAIKEPEPEAELNQPEIYLKTEEIEKKPSCFNKKLFVILLITLVVAGVIAGGIIISRKAIKQQEEVEKPGIEQLPESSETSSPSTLTDSSVASESSTPTELQRSALKIQVLNGTGEYGVARTAREILEEAGYEDIDADNAESFDYDKTVIQIKDDKKKYLEMLKKDLEEKYALQEESVTLDKESEFDAIVIIGGDKASK